MTQLFEPMYPSDPVPEAWGNIYATPEPSYDGPYPSEALVIAPQPGQYVVPDVQDRSVSAAERVAAAQEVLAQAIPGVETSLLSDKGVYGIVLHDGERAYKVFCKQPLVYSMVENEAAAMAVMGREGVAPRLVALVDAAWEYRRDPDPESTSVRLPQPLFGGHEHIPRVPSENPVPIIVSELIQDAQPIGQASLPPEFIVQQFDTVLDAFMEHCLRRPEDCDVVYDPHNNRLVMMDFGWVYDIMDYNPHARAHYAELTDQEYSLAFTVGTLLRGFRPKDPSASLGLAQAAELLRSQGMDGVHAILTSPREPGNG